MIKYTEEQIRTFIIQSLIDSKIRELNNPNAYAISLIERDIIEEVRGWNLSGMNEWLEYHCNICLDEGDELPTIEN
jgi:hypothetical protein